MLIGSSEGIAPGPARPPLIEPQSRATPCTQMAGSVPGHLESSSSAPPCPALTAGRVSTFIGGQPTAYDRKSAWLSP